VGEVVSCGDHIKRQSLDSPIQAVLQRNQDGFIASYLAWPLGLTAVERDVPTKFKDSKEEANSQVIRRWQIHIIGGGIQIVLLKLDGNVATGYLTNPCWTLERAITGTTSTDVQVLPLNGPTQKERFRGPEGLLVGALVAP
jgi:hypothetical protein